MAPETCLTYVRPGPSAFAWLAGTVRELKGSDPFRPVTVLVPNDFAGRTARWHLARDGGYVNVRTDRLTGLAAALAPGHPKGPLDPLVEASAARVALRRVGGPLASIDHPSLRRALVDLFRELRRAEVDVAALATTEVSPVTRAALAIYGEFSRLVADYETPTSAADAASRRLLEARMLPPRLARLGALVLFLPTRLDPAEARLLAAAARWVSLVAAFIATGDPDGLGDRPGQEAARLLAQELGVPEPTVPSAQSGLPPLLEGECSPSGRRGRGVLGTGGGEEEPSTEAGRLGYGATADLVARVPLTLTLSPGERGHLSPASAAVGSTLHRSHAPESPLPGGEGQGEGDRGSGTRCCQPVQALAFPGGPPLVAALSPGARALASRADAAKEPPRHRGPVGEIRVLRAPEPAEEVREVVRRIAADLERGVPLYEVGIVYRQNDPYAALARDALDAAGLPWVSSEGEHLDETRPGRCLLSLLRLPGDDFSREALLAWLETAPGPVAPAATLSAAAWNRLARAANVVRGVGQWRDRLAAYVARLEAVRAGEGEDEGSARSAARGRQAEAARRAAALIGNLVRDLQPPAPGVSWSAFVDWVAGLRDRYVGRPEDWTEDDGPAARALDDEIQRLRLLDDVDPQPTPATFLGALADALAGGRVRHGRFGEGILVEPLVAVTGLAFTRLYVLGLGEGRFPPPPPVDPFFGASSPSGDGDPLRRRERWLAEERRDFLVCLSAADGGAMTLSAPDADGQRATSPSRWLLEAAEKLVGRPLDAASFADLDEAAHPWLRVVRSAHDGVRRADPPADLEDRRLAEAAHWLAAGRALTAHPLAARSDLPLGRALALGGARGSLELTEFDGNLSRRARGSRRLLGIFADRRPISTSALETWAACGFRYFLDRVVGIEPGGLSAEESPEIEARERGDVIHAVLDDFFRRLKRDGRPRPGERYTAADARLLADVAVEHFANLAARGAAGHPLAWENVQRAILADLQAFLAADAAWRRDHGLTPVAFEQRFGFSSEDSWDAATVSVPDENGGLRLRFRGLIDRIDRDEAGRAVVLDYKTGASEGYRGLGEDPVLAGQHLQLALYRRVVQEHLPGVTAVGGAFWFVTSRGGLRLVSIGDDGALVDRRLEEVLAIVARGIRAGAFPAVPGPARWPSGFAGCSSCDFDRVCAARRDVLWRRKQADPLAAIHRALSVTGDTGDGE